MNKRITFVAQLSLSGSRWIDPPFKNTTCLTAVSTASSYTVKRMLSTKEDLFVLRVGNIDYYFIVLQGVLESVQYNINE